MTDGSTHNAPRRRNMPSMHRSSGGSYPARPVNQEEALRGEEHANSFALHVAVFKSGVNDARGKNNVDRVQMNAARRWIFSKHDTGVIPFSQCCYILGVDPEATRELISESFDIPYRRYL